MVYVNSKGNIYADCDFSYASQDQISHISILQDKSFDELAKEYAQAFCVNERINCRSVAITLDCFENSVIDFICEKGLYINVFPTEKEPLGKIVSLNRFAEDLSVFLEDY